jgi:hypothetical protein
VDGALSDSIWSGGGWFSIGRNVLGTPGLISGVFKTAWDSTNLYVAVDVSDYALYKDSANRWEDDSVEIYIDYNNAGSATYQADDEQYSARYDGTGGISTANGHGTGVTVSTVTKAGNAGYTMEWVIPWSNYGGAPSAGSTIGFDVGINSDVDGGNRDGALAWAGTSSNWNNTSAFGDVTLGSCGTPTATHTGTRTPTPSATRTASPTPTITFSPTRTATGTITGTPTRTPSFTVSPTNGPTTPTITQTPIAVPMTKSQSVSSATIGDTVTYCMTWTNNTGGAASISIWDTVPITMAYLSCWAASGSLSSCSYSPRVTLFTIGAAIANGASGQVCFSAVITGYPWTPGFDAVAWLAWLAREGDLEPVQASFTPFGATP